MGMEDDMIDWKDAPKWATYAAMDGGGNWYWYEREPNLDPTGNFCHWFGGGKMVLVDDNRPFWKDSLRERPE